MLRSQRESRCQTNKNQSENRRRFQIAIECISCRKEEKSASRVGGYASSVRYSQWVEYPYGKGQNSRPCSEHFTACHEKKNGEQYRPTPSGNACAGKYYLCVIAAFKQK